MSIRYVPENISTYNTDHHCGSTFQNNAGEPSVVQSRRVGPMMMFKFIGAERDYDSPIPLRMCKNDFSSDENVRAWWIGHSTILLKFGEKYALTDPIFADYASPVPFVVRRKTPPGCLIEDLPQISYVFVSHDHWDHLCSSSIEAIKRHSPSAIFFAPLVTASLINSWVGNTVAFDWRQTLKIDQLHITAFPARHACNRYGVDFRERLWCSFLFQYQEKSVFFPGDTGIGPHFAEVREYNGRPIDLALMPIGPQEPTDIMRAVHLNPDDAIDMSEVLEARVTIPIHWGTFGLGMKPAVDDITLFKRNWRGGKLIVLKAGGYLEWNGEEFQSNDESICPETW